jgi:hypothetical protein
LRGDDLILPADRRGKIILTSASPRTGAAWTSTGTPHEPRGLEHPPSARSASCRSRRSWRACYAVTCAGPAPRRTGGCSVAPAAACSASRFTAAPGTPPARPRSARSWPPRPWPAALSLWLNATRAPAEVAARAGNSARVLHDVYLRCTDGQDDIISQRIEDALAAGATAACSSRSVITSGSAHRRFRPDPVRIYVRELVPRPGHGPRPPGPAGSHHHINTPAVTGVSAVQSASESLSAETGSRPDPAHTSPTDHSRRSDEPLPLTPRAGDANPASPALGCGMCGRCWVRTNVG